jgi:hypothetical protein
MNRKLFLLLSEINLFIFNLVVFIPLFRNFSIGNESFSNYLLLVLMFLYILFSYLANPNFFFSKKVKIYVLIIFYFFFVSIFTNNFPVFKRYFTVIFLFFYSFVLDYYLYNNLNLKKFSSFIIFLFPYFLLISLYFIQTNPFLIRNVNFESVDFNNYRLYGVVGYDHIYSLVLMIPLLAKNIINEKSIILRFLSFFIIIFGAILIFQAGFSLAILIFLPSLLLSPLMGKVSKENIVKIIFFGSIFVFFSVIIMFLLLSDTFYFEKIKSFFELIFNGENSNILSDRLLTYFKSLKTFFDYPLFGVIYNGSLRIDDFTNSDVLIGLHSLVLDIAALFGLFFTFIVFYLFFEKFLKLFLKSKMLIFIFGSFLFFLIITFNVDFPLIGLVFFVIFPSLFLKYNKGVYIYE